MFILEVTPESFVSVYSYLPFQETPLVPVAALAMESVAGRMLIFSKCKTVWVWTECVSLGNTLICESLVPKNMGNLKEFGNITSIYLVMC